ncbi:MAG TPA: hypothetical protein VFN35_34480 [Ktedonobacteraceae bacterium]|nr:hypothetical protein [Ktedonobacteraceae bacterium]
MDQIQDRLEQAFHSQDLVLWHAQVDGHPLLIPAVVVRLQENHVIIRARVNGGVREYTVSPDELVSR